MFNASDFTTGKRVTSKELQEKGPLAGVITNAEVVEFTDKQTGKMEKKPSITLDVKGEERNVILNRTNLAAIAGVYGDSAAKWVGKKLGFIFDPTVSFGGRLVGGIKVKFPKDVAPEPDFDVDDDSL